MGCDINTTFESLWETKMTETASLTVTGMKCGGCENNVTSKLLALDGVKTASASSKEKAVNVEFDPDKTSLDAIKQAITDVGYTVGDEN
jgi:copper chaperone